MASPISPPPITAYRPNDLPAHLSNGMIGLRVREIPLRNGIAIVNGYSGEDPTVRIEATPARPIRWAQTCAWDRSGSRRFR